MLDANTISHIVKQHSAVIRRLGAAPVASLCLSSITAGELLYGLEKRPAATRLRAAVHEFMRSVEVLPWDQAPAQRFGIIRAELERRGTPIASLELLIAAHALAVDAVLVTSDRAFRHVAGLRIEDWMAG
jgi:tRNA(fMet)-specific endonuclease VapC